MNIKIKNINTNEEVTQDVIVSNLNAGYFAYRIWANNATSNAAAKIGLGKIEFNVKL